MPLSRLVAGVLALLCFALPARANPPSIQLLGWSGDEQRFAVREYDHTDLGESGMDEPPPPCPGYVDHEGKPFTGSLTLSVYEKGKQRDSFSIQDGAPCTPPKEAKARLAQAKQALAKLGIDLKQKKVGTELTPDAEGRIRVNEGPGAPYTLVAEHRQPPKKKAAAQEAESSAEEDPNVPVEVNYSLVVSVDKDGKRRQLFSRKVEGTYTPMLGGRYSTELNRVWLSPTGQTLVFITLTSSGNMRGREESLEVLGALSWAGAPLVLR
jgi:hypothetical protein